jgi:hypothetical protein
MDNMFDIISAVAGLLGISGLDLRDRLKEYQKNRKLELDTAAANARRAAGERIARTGLLKTVAEYYRQRGLGAAGGTEYAFLLGNRRIGSAIAVKPEWVGCDIPITRNSEMARFIQIPQPKAYFPKDEILDLLYTIELMQLRLWPAAIYRLVDVSLGLDRLETSFAEDEFIRYRFSEGLVIDELVKALMTVHFDPALVLTSTQKLLRIREKVLPDGQALFNFRNRICAGGITMVFAVARPQPHNDFAVVVQRRSGIVADGQGMLSIIPRAFHQPMVDVELEIAPSFTGFREIFEELFGGDEAEAHVRRIRHDWFLGEEPMRWFVDYPDRYDFFFTCFGIDMVSGNYQFGTLLVIRDETYWDTYGRALQANWEGAEREGVRKGTWFQSTRAMGSMHRLLEQPDWTGEGLVGFVEGLRLLRAKYPERVRLPAIEVVL